MADEYETCMERARAAARDAASAPLANQKARALRSERAWRELAGRVARMKARREKAQAQRAQALPAG